MNYYELLNVKETASASEIKKSYKALVKKYHPDVYDGDKTFAEKKLKEINQAYEILSDQSSRAEYDRVLNSVREETSKIFSESNENGINENNYTNDYYQKQKEDLEKRYNEMYNYDYYKRYTTNYYGVDKSKEKYYDHENTESSTLSKIKLYINKYVSGAQTKVLILILALLLIVGLITTIFLLSKVRYLLTDSFNTVEQELGTSSSQSTPSQNNNTTFQPNYNSTVDGNYIYNPYINTDPYANQDLNKIYEEYANYLSTYLSADFDGIIKNGISILQVSAFYGEPDKYVENDEFVYAYYQDSYIIYNNQGIVVGFENNGYFMTEEELNTITN